MASPGELVRLVSEVLGVPETTVFQYDRILATAGLRVKGGRGRSAAKMTSRDAANLLIGVAASNKITTSADEAAVYVSLPAIERRTREEEFINPGPGLWKLAGLGLDQLSALPEGHSLATALTTLIDMARSGELLLSEVDKATPRGKDLSLNVSVRFFAPFPRAEIEIISFDPPYPFEEVHYRELAPEENGAQWRETRRAKYGDGDLKQIREFTARTIFAVADLLKS